MTAARWRDVGEDLAAALATSSPTAGAWARTSAAGRHHVMMVPDTSIRLVN